MELCWPVIDKQCWWYINSSTNKDYGVIDQYTLNLASSGLLLYLYEANKNKLSSMVAEAKKNFDLSVLFLVTQEIMKRIVKNKIEK